ncbi:MAG: P27 family phage terminase small subunit [Leuconostoc mesenteroides]
MPRKGQLVKEQLLSDDRRRLTKDEFKRRQENQDKLDVGADKVIAPRWLNSEKKDIFYTIRNTLKETELIKNTDVDLLVMYANVWYDYQWIAKQLQEILDRLNKLEKYLKKYEKYEGDDEEIIENIRKYKMESSTSTGSILKLGKEKRDLANQVVKIGKEIGLSPTARASLAITIGGDSDEPEQDEFDD